MAVRLDQVQSDQAFRQRPLPGHGNVYWIRPIFSDSNSNGYVGITVQDFCHRLASHLCKNSRCIGIYSALKKHGKSNFVVEFLETNVPEELLGEREMHWIAEKNSYLRGYNGTKGGEDMPMLDPNVRAKHKKTMNSEPVKTKKRAAATEQWKPGGSLREQWHASFTKTAKTPEYKERKSSAAKEIRSRPELEVQRGLAKRRTTLRKRAERRALLKTEKERRAFDSNVRRKDKHLAKKGFSVTQQRIATGEIVL